MCYKEVVGKVSSRIFVDDGGRATMLKYYKFFATTIVQCCYKSITFLLAAAEEVFEVSVMWVCNIEFVLLQLF
jgi:hypothetical protein